MARLSGPTTVPEEKARPNAAAGSTGRSFFCAASASPHASATSSRPCSVTLTPTAGWCWHRFDEALEVLLHGGLQKSELVIKGG